MVKEDQEIIMAQNGDINDVDGKTDTGEEVSMQDLNSARKPSDSQTGFGSPNVARTNGYCSSEEESDIASSKPAENENIKDDASAKSDNFKIVRRDSTSSSGSDLNLEKLQNDDSSLPESDDTNDDTNEDTKEQNNVTSKADVNSDSDSDENPTEPNKPNSASNSISSDSAYDDKWAPEDKSTAAHANKKGKSNDFERIKALNKDTLDGVKVKNVKFGDEDKPDDASQCSSDDNHGSKNNSPKPRVRFFDNKGFTDDEGAKPQKRRTPAVSFAVAPAANENVYADDNSSDSNNDSEFDDDEFGEDTTKIEKDQKEWLRRQDFISAITSLLSLMYGGIVILLGFVFPLTEALHSQWLTTTSVAVFNVYLYLLSTIFLIYMSLDIWTWIDQYFPNFGQAGRGRGGAAGSRQRRGGTSQRGHGDDDGHAMTDEIYNEVMGLRQTASLSNEGASFYLRLGALIFGIANFIYVVVQIDQYYNQKAYNCKDRPAVYPMYFHLIFVGVQTFYIFKDTTVKVRRFRSVARFGFMHVLATNMCNWIRILVFEVMEGMYKTRKDIDKRTKLYGGVHENTSYNNSYNDDHSSGHGDSYAKDDHGSGHDDHGGNYSGTSCLHLEGLYMSIAPYLFPFVLEYSLIAAATMYGMYTSLNVRVTQDVIQAVKKSVMNRRKSSADLGALLQSKQESENMFAKSHRGMYCGAIMLAGALISMIMFHYTVSSEAGSKDEYKALEIYLLSDICLHVVMIPPIIYLAVRFSKFKFSFNRENSIDDTLLLVSLSGLVLYYSFVILTTTTGVLFLENEPVHQIHRTTALSLVYALLNIFQGMIQGIFVVAGLQLCAPTRKQALDKPGRGAITFLLIGNLSLWLFKSFQVKEVNLHKFVDFFGPIAWPIIMNTCLPLVLFYRFHVSVCLADIWVSVYKPETGPTHKMIH